MPIIGSEGAASSGGFGQFARTAVPNYIEDVFSTYLYTGQGSTNSYTNGIDLAGKGGLVWIKSRSGTYATAFHGLWDTARGTGKILSSNSTAAQSGNSGDLLSAFNSDGFTVNTTYLGGFNETTNASATNYASWTFREQPKFFDVVTYTGNGTSGRTIAHNLGSVPGCIIVKDLTTVEDWDVYHTSLGNTKAISLNTTGAAYTSSTRWNNTSPTATEFTVGGAGTVNRNGDSYVAYLFAHDAGGFGLTGTDNVISCGSYTGNGSATGPVVTLGYEPQWLLVKQSSSSGNWFLTDTMRGFSQTSDQFLLANSSGAEFTRTNYVNPLATGFQIATADFDLNESGGTYIYIAIRRGPMKVPTTGTSVFDIATTSTSRLTGDKYTTSLDVFDLVAYQKRASGSSTWQPRLTAFKWMQTVSTDGENLYTYIKQGGNQKVYEYIDSWDNAANYIDYRFRRAPGFFDVVCYTGMGGGGGSITHNLGVAPQLIIVKKRSSTGNWIVRPPGVANNYLVLNSTANSQSGAGNYINNPTATTFGIGDNADVNVSGATFVAYLFASCPGVSKVGSFSYATGSSTDVDCGFTSGARFVMIKQTDGADSWYVFDTARGIVSGNDPFLQLNSTAAENSSFDVIDPLSTGFSIPAGALGTGNFIFLAIA
jgi:hypothetical protein